MRNFVVASLIAVLSGSAAADWVELAVLGDDISIAYFDPATIRRSGDRAKMWDLYDFRKVQVSGPGKTYSSSKKQVEYDCKNERSRILAFTFYSGRMGWGEIVADHDEPTKWVPVTPRTAGESLWKIACGQRSIPTDPRIMRPPIKDQFGGTIGKNEIDPDSASDPAVVRYTFAYLSGKNP